MQTKEIKKVFTEDGKEKEYVATLKRFSYKDMNELEDASTEIVFTGTEKEGKAVLRQGALKTQCSISE